jgi:hypothetical protein
MPSVAMVEMVTRRERAKYERQQQQPRQEKQPISQPTAHESAFFLSPVVGSSLDL